MSGVELWPALAGLGDPDRRPSLRIERAAWGKVHGASSDFRWIAATPGFASLTERPELEISLGVEVEPAIFGLWRSTRGCLLAARCHPSRAIDTSGRGGTLEKQVVGCRPPDDLPAAAAAAILLPMAEELDDGCWWGAAAAEAWEDDSRYVLDLTALPEVRLSRGRLEAAVATACRALSDWADGQGGEDLLAALFAGLLADASPVVHGSDFAPLHPLHLTALLLPFDRRVADRLSIAGWTPSKRRPSAQLGRLWDLVVHDSSVGPPADLAQSPPDLVARARAMARAVLRGDPSELGTLQRPDASGTPSAQGMHPGSPGPDRSDRGRAERTGPDEPPEAFPFPRVLDLAAPTVQSGAWRLLHAFACDPKRRWLAPDELAESLRRDPSPVAPEAVETAAGWIRCLESSIPPGVSREQWQVKADLVRAAVSFLAPGTRTVELVGPPRSQRVPLSYYADAFAGRSLR